MISASTLSWLHRATTTVLALATAALSLAWKYRENFWKLREDRHSRERNEHLKRIADLSEENNKQAAQIAELSAERNEHLKQIATAVQKPAGMEALAAENAYRLKTAVETVVYTAGEGYNPVRLQVKVNGTTAYFLDSANPPTYTQSVSCADLRVEPTSLAGHYRVYFRKDVAWNPSKDQREIDAWARI